MLGVSPSLAAAARRSPRGGGGAPHNRVMATRMTSTRFVGRAPELVELRAALAEALEERPSLAFVAGESGLGKTRLISELERSARADGVRVVGGECVELGEGELPYAPLVTALRPLVRSGDPALDALSPTARESLAHLLPGLSVARSNGREESGAQARVFEGLLELLDRLAGEDGLLLTIEDLHWADRSTRAFLVYLASSLCRERVLVVASYRPDELHRRHPLRPLLAELERDARHRRVELFPLTRAELAEQLTDILGDAPPDELVGRLFARSEGNPLFAEELLAAGLDGRGTLPPTLRDALMLRIERLSGDAQELLRLLAAGRRLDHGTLADAARMDARLLRDALREAVAAHLVVVDGEGRYEFRHALLREVVADDLLPGERADLHLALARTLEEQAAGLPAHGGAHLAAGIAHHYYAAGDQPAALAASVRAADAANGVHAHGEAAALLQRALRLWDRVPNAQELTGLDHVELLHRAAMATGGEHEPARAESLLRAALAEIDEAADPQRAAVILERMAREQFNLGHAEQAVQTRKRALALLPDAPSEARAQVLAGQMRELMLESRYRDAVEKASEALEVARAVGDEVSEVRVLNGMGTSLFGLGRNEEGEKRAPRGAAQGARRRLAEQRAQRQRQPGRRAGRRRPAHRGARDRRGGRGHRPRARPPAALELTTCAPSWPSRRATGRRPRRRFRHPRARRWARRSSTTRCAGSSSPWAAASTTGPASCSSRPRTSAPTRASRSGSARWVRCARSSSVAPVTSRRPGRRSTARSTGSTSAPTTWPAWPGCRRPACAWRPTPPCGRATSARTPPAPWPAPSCCWPAWRRARRASPAPGPTRPRS